MLLAIGWLCGAGLGLPCLSPSMMPLPPVSYSACPKGFLTWLGFTAGNTEMRWLTVLSFHPYALGFAFPHSQLSVNVVVC